MSEILNHFRSLYDSKGDAIESWLAAQRKQAAPFVYTSVDLRHSGLRLVPVDTNLFPAGFNNLSPSGAARAGRYFKAFLSEHYPQAKKILLIPENHTRNLSYLQNLWRLKEILTDAGAEVAIGSLTAEMGKPLELVSSEGKALVEYAVAKQGGRVVADGGFTPDIILMNNDMTAGIPDVIQGISQPVIPSPEVGWWQRRKSVHFCAYQQLAKSFGAEFGVDPWLISAEFHQCGVVDFKERTGLDCVAKGVDKVLECAREKHKQYGIAEDPYVYVKADSGTYGMGIMTVRSGSEMMELNKKDRNKMHMIKEGTQVSEVIIQEGIPTIDTVDSKPAEPMIYMVDGLPVGGMYRVNGQRDAQNNLNATGVEFTGMCDEDEPSAGKQPIVGCHFRSFGLVAALAALASPRESYGAEEKERRLRCQPCA
jgi:glutamate--cysteine ligase